ncbi:right-handed parallel beta-helix repeat-containing protein [Candidatus Fermentibacteria bacterium]|nr:right-handed parallel beta-helix repeat-containing protein [Candidatus Fermentibacteria bacterium]
MRTIVFVMWLSSFSAIQASTYYVSPAGNDSWPGTAAQPWASPGYGSKHMAGGDTLVVLSGDYVMAVFYDDMLTPPSGSAGAPTAVLGQGPSRPRFLGAGSLFSCADIEDGAHIVMKNLECTSLIDTPYTGGARAGINAGSTVHDLLFEDIEIHHTEELAFNLGGDAGDITIRRCSIHRNGYTALGGPGGSGDGWVNVLIDSCSLSYSGHFYNGHDQQSPWDRPDGLGFEASEGPVEVRYTVAEHNLGDGLDSKARRTYIHHCIVANNFADGVKLWGDSSRVENTLIYATGGGDTTPSPWCLLVIGTDDAGGTFEITNVTMWDSPYRHPHYTATVQYDESTVPTTLILRNVIVAGLRQFYVSPIVTVIAENNLFDIDAAEQITANGTTYTCATVGDLGTGNFCGDPQFAAPAWGASGDFHVDESSPAVDSGLDNGLPDDLDLFPRPYNAAYDRGCYEYHPPCFSFPIETEATLPRVAFWPNPARGFTRLAGGGPWSEGEGLVLLDMAGRRMGVQTRPDAGRAAPALFIDLDDIPAGVYALALRRGTRHALVPLVVLQ